MGDLGTPRMPHTNTTTKHIIESSVLNHSPGKIQTRLVGDVGTLKMPRAYTTPNVLIESYVLNHTPAKYTHSI